MERRNRIWFAWGAVALAAALGVTLCFQKLREAKQDRLDEEILAAAKGGEFAVVLDLLQEGANPDGVPGHHVTPILYAAREGEPEVVQALLDAGAGPEGGGLLQAAIMDGDVAAFQRWLVAGLDPDRPAPMSVDYNVLQVISDTVWRSDLGEPEALEMARLAIEHGVDVDRHGMHGFTPLILAVSKQQAWMVELLLENGAEIGLTDEEGWNALDMAAFRQDGELVALLVDHGAEPGIQEAVSLGRIDQVRDLVAADRSCLERQCIGGNRPLGIALKHGHLEVARWLVEAGANVAVRNEEQETMLHLAARGNLAEMVGLLIERGAEVDARDRSEETPLHETTFTDCAASARALIAAGADVEAQNSSHITPLVWAASYDSPGVLGVLIEAGADPDGQGEGTSPTPLHSACHYSRKDGVSASIVALVEAGADVNQRDASGRTALHWAVEWFGGAELVAYLLEQGADPAVADRSGKTPEALARAAGKDSLVELLTSGGGGPDG